MPWQSPRDLPSLAILFEGQELSDLRQDYGDGPVKLALRAGVEWARSQILAGDTVSLGELLHWVEHHLRPSYARVINATGTLLHTNLGRAPLGDILVSVASELRGYNALEYDRFSGKRGRRGERAEWWLTALTGTQAALVVNNCAGALLLLLTAIARGREVIVSRGELVEVGGGFRIPDVLEQSGARLVEVGTTNRTRISDVAKAIGESTALILKTHRSNFHMTGFVSEPEDGELIALGRERGVLVAFDLGSGMLTSVLASEPGVARAVAFPVCSFSGDKLLGGPQCGILLGDSQVIEACRHHPLMRALRCDKLTLALLEETLRRHATGAHGISLIELLRTPVEDLYRRACVLAARLAPLAPKVVSSQAVVGGGSAPEDLIASWAISVSPPPGVSASGVQRRLCGRTIPVIARVEKQQLLFDLRTVFEAEDRELAEAVEASFT